MIDLLGSPGPGAFSLPAGRGPDSRSGRCLRRSAVAPVLVIALALVLASGAPAATPYEQALAREKAADFGGALVLLDRAKTLTESESKHREALRDAVSALTAVDVYEARDQLGPAEKVLTQQLESLDAVRDAFVVAEVSRRFEAVQAERKDAEQDGFFSEIWQSTVDAAETVAGWVGYVVIALAFVALLWLLRRVVLARLPPKRGLAISLDDVSAEPSERAGKNRVLARELQGAIRAAGDGAGGAGRAEFEIAKDLDGSVLLNVRVVGDELAQLEQYLATDTPVRFGPLSVSPRQVLDLIRYYGRPRSEHELSGFLAAYGDTTTLALQLAGKQRETLSRWSVAFTGEDARAQAIADAAGHVLFDLGSSSASSWESISWHRRAWRQIGKADEATGDEREAALNDASRWLERSLAHDPANELARFDLGTVLRTLGRNAEAVAQFGLIDSLLSRREDAPLGLRWAVRYNRACALAKIDNWDSHNDAVRSLEELLQDVEDDENRASGEQRLTAAERRRLMLHARSGLAAALVFELERWRHEDEDAKLRERRRAVFARVTEARDWLAALPMPDLDWVAYTQADAVIENACGRSAYVLGRPARDCIPAFEKALARTPDFGDAHVNMASALLRWKARYPDWDVRAIRHLERVLEMSPHSQKALYLLGQVYVGLGRLDDAMAAFERAGDDPWALFRRAELLWRDSRQEAMALTRRSLRRRAGTDYRARLFLEWVADMAGRDEADKELLSEARALGQTFASKAEKRKRPLPPSVSEALKKIAAALES